jgi:hypothetical protein
MKIGAVYPQIELRGDPEAVRRIGISVESLGFDYLLTYDHVLGATHEGRDPKLTGPGSNEAKEAQDNPVKAMADFMGIIVHCAKNSPRCAKHGAKDILPDEPGGYQGFEALYGNANVQPQISSTGPVKDLDGVVIDDGNGNVGFTGFSPLATPIAWLYRDNARSRRPGGVSVHCGRS